MCGIIGYTGKRNAKDVILSGLFSLEYRGYDSAGMAVAAEGKTVTVKTAGKVKMLENAADSLNLCGSIGIGHTRWATHGAHSEIKRYKRRMLTRRTLTVVYTAYYDALSHFLGARRESRVAHIEAELGELRYI